MCIKINQICAKKILNALKCSNKHEYKKYALENEKKDFYSKYLIK